MSKEVQIKESLEAINKSLSEANHAFFDSVYQQSDKWHNHCAELTKYYIEEAFIQLLVMLEALDLSRTYEQVNKIYQKAELEGFDKSAMGIEEPYLIWHGVISNYVDAVAKSHGIHSKLSVSQDLISILREAAYAITDRKIFDSPPTNESEVHARIEAILRCVFRGLKHKPRLAKPIKNFEPDTGLSSIQTLIEYKFVSNKRAAKVVADQILADTRGYVSKEWDTFLYVIYETRRIKPESEWQQLMHECGVDRNTQIIVISGEPPESKQSSKKKAKSRSIKKQL